MADKKETKFQNIKDETSSLEEDRRELEKENHEEEKKFHKKLLNSLNKFLENFKNKSKEDEPKTSTTTNQTKQPQQNQNQQQTYNYQNQPYPGLSNTKKFTTAVGSLSKNIAKTSYNGAINTYSNLRENPGSKLNTTSILMLGILLYVIDTFIVRTFDGVFLNDFIFQGILNPNILKSSLFLASFLIYGFLNSKNLKDWIFQFFFWYFVISLATYGFSEGTFYRIVILPFIIIPVLRRADDKNKILVLSMFFLAIDYFLLSSVNNIIPMDLNLRAILPVWFFFGLLVTADTEKNKFDNFLTIVVIVFICFGTFSTLTTSINIGSFSKSASSDATNDFLVFYDKFKTNVNSTFQSFLSAGKLMKNQTALISSEQYYTGEIDKNAQKRLGVYIEEIHKTLDKFYVDEPISFWSPIVISSLGEREIFVKTNCIANKEREGYQVMAQTHNPKNFNASNYDKVSVDCTFDRLSFNREGYNTFYVSAKFNFSTNSYQKIYFMDKEKVRSLVTQQIDPLTYYGITDTDPKTIYTDGPVMVGMNFIKNPVEIDTTSPTDVYITPTITLTNDWEGKILNITNFEFIIPKGFEEFINKDERNLVCSGYNFTCVNHEEGTRLCKYDFKKPLPKIETQHNFRCPLKVSDGNKLLVLGESPLSIRYFRVNVEYEYELEKKTAFQVEYSPSIKELKTKTANSQPNLDLPEALYIKQNQSKSIDLHKITSDEETKNPKYFKYTIIKQTDKSVIDCKIMYDQILNCTSANKKGTSEISITINDLATIKTKKFIINVSNLTCDWTDISFNECKQITTYLKTKKPNNGDNPTTESEGPVLQKNFEDKYILRGKTPQFIAFITHIKDGDEKTENKDLNYIFHKDDGNLSKILQDREFKSYNFIAKNDYVCTTNYTYPFSVTDGDGNKEDFNLTFDIIGDNCNSDCTKCTNKGCCIMSLSRCTWDEDSCIKSP